MLVPEAGRRSSMPVVRLRTGAPVDRSRSGRRLSSNSTASARASRRQRRTPRRKSIRCCSGCSRSGVTNPAMPAAKFKDRYGHWPNGLAETPASPGRDVPELAEVATDRLPQAPAEGGRRCCMSLSRIARLAGGTAFCRRSACPAKALSNRHGPCPMCGGKDRFRFDDKGGRGTWICSQCGAGDGIELVKRIQNVEFKEAARLIEQHVGSAPIIASAKRPSADRRAEARRDDRALETVAPDHARRSCRPVSQCSHRPDDFPAIICGSRRTSVTPKPGKRPTWHPVMVAKVDPSDAAAARRRTGRAAPDLSQSLRDKGGSQLAAQDDGHHADRRGRPPDAAPGHAGDCRRH